MAEASIDHAVSQARDAFAAERARWEPLIGTMDFAVDQLGKGAQFTVKAVDGTKIQVTYSGVSERQHQLASVSVLTTDPVNSGDIDDGTYRFIRHGWLGEPDFSKTGIDPLSDDETQAFEVGPSENNRIIRAIIDAATRYGNEQPGSLAAAGCLMSARLIYMAEIELGKHRAEVLKAETHLASCRFAYEMFVEKATEIHPEAPNDIENAGPRL